jgi:hypothetical protein
MNGVYVAALGVAVAEGLDPPVLPAPQVTIDLVVSGVQEFTVSADSAAVSVRFTYGNLFSETFDLTVHLAQTTGSPRIQLTTDGGTPGYVAPEAVTAVDPASTFLG